MPPKGRSTNTSGRGRRNPPANNNNNNDQNGNNDQEAPYNQVTGTNLYGDFAGEADNDLPVENTSGEDPPTNTNMTAEEIDAAM